MKDDSIIEDVTQTNLQIIEKDQTKLDEKSEKVKDKMNVEETKVTSNLTIVEDKKTSAQDNKPPTKKSKTTKKIPIREIPIETKDNTKETPEKDVDNNVNARQEVQNQGNGDNAASTSEGAVESNVKGNSQKQIQIKRTELFFIEVSYYGLILAQTDGDGVALINYMRRLNTEEIDEDNLDLEPSAEDLEIFAELDREEVERQARIDRGEPPFDPMVRYNKILDNYIEKVETFRN